MRLFPKATPRGSFLTLLSCLCHPSHTCTPLPIGSSQHTQPAPQYCRQLRHIGATCAPTSASALAWACAITHRPPAAQANALRERSDTCARYLAPGLSLRLAWRSGWRNGCFCFNRSCLAHSSAAACQ